MVEVENKKSVLLDLKSVSPIYEKDDYIEVTEWTNGEGYDISIDTKRGTKIFSLHYDELKAINFLSSFLDFTHYNKNLKLVD